jgi:hypothetical protein
MTKTIARPNFSTLDYELLWEFVPTENLIRTGLLRYLPTSHSITCHSANPNALPDQCFNNLTLAWLNQRRDATTARIEIDRLVPQPC